MEGFSSTIIASFSSLLKKLLTLFVLSFFVYPLVQEFCLFLACSFVVSFLLHGSFFLAVLSVDIRRLELQDFLDSNSSNRNSKWWVPYLEYVRFMWSPWIIDNLGTVSFHMYVIYLQLQSSTDINGSWRLASPNIRFLITLYHRLGRILRERKLFPLITTGWFGDSTFLEALKEKTMAENLVIALYRPVILDTVNRHDYTNVYNSFHDRRVWRWSTFFSILFAIDFAVGLLVKALLRGWSDHDELSTDTTLHEEKFRIEPVPVHHQLDILKIAVSENYKTFASVGLDRCLVVWDLRQWCTKLVLSKEQMPRTLKAIALDPQGNYVSLFSKDTLFILNVESPCLMLQHSYHCKPNSKLNVFWMPGTHKDDEWKNFELVVVESSGEIQVFSLTIEIEGADIALVEKFQLSSPIIKSISIVSPTANRIACLTESGEVTVYSKKGPVWSPKILSQNKNYLTETKKDIYGIAMADILFLARDSGVDMIDLKNDELLHSFTLPPIKVNTFSVGVSNSRFVNGQFRVSSISFCFTHAVTEKVLYYYYGNECNESYIILNKWDQQPNLVDVHDPDNSLACLTFDELQENIHEVEDASECVMSSDGLYIFGMRRKSSSGICPTADEKNEDNGFTLRNRKLRTGHYNWTSYVPLLDSYMQDMEHKKNTHSGGETQVWEVWMYSQSEKKHRCKSLKMYNSLIIADPGPSLAVSDRCVAIVLGNYVALVGYGSEIFRDFYQIRNSDEMDRILRRKRKNLQRKRSGTIGC